MSRQLRHGEGDEVVPLPEAVVEQPTTKTSIYNQGKLVYDGASGTTPDGASSAAAGPSGNSLNELLNWGIANSDPEELKRRAAEGGAAPKPIDKEIMDMILGEPIVAKMRACMEKMGAPALAEVGGAEVALSAFEELEYYVEDLDNANDFAKIGGLQVMVDCCSEEHSRAAELREAACGVLAACMQNNPKLQEAAVTLGIPDMLIGLLREGGPPAVRRKALTALSALLRAAPATASTVLALPELKGTLVQLAATDDRKLQRRALFLLQALLADGSLAPGALMEASPEVPAALLSACCDGEDEDVANFGSQVLLALLGCSECAGSCVSALRVPEVEADRRVSDAMKAALQAADGNPDVAQNLRKLLAHVRK